MPPEGRSWRYTSQRMSELIADKSILVRDGRRPVLKRYLADIAGEEEPASDGVTPPPIIALVGQFSRALAHRLALCPAELADVEWRDLERLLGEVCAGLGFHTRVTRSGKDGGFDLELKAAGDVYLVEVKHWAVPEKVGTGHVAHFAEVVVTQNAQRGLIVSTSGFRQAVMRERVEVVQHRVALGDGRKVIGLCQRYVERQSGMWWPESQLPCLLFEGTA
jgi:hypothetical protein